MPLKKRELHHMAMARLQARRGGGGEFMINGNKYEKLHISFIS